MPADFWDFYIGASGEGTPSMVDEVGGNLEIELATNVRDSYAGYVTEVGYDLRGRAMVIRVLETSTSPSANCYATIVAADESENIGIIANTDFLQILSDAGELARTPFSLADKPWWRIREDAGVLWFETSRDGRAWTAFASFPAEPYVAAVKPNIGGGTFAPASGAGRCRFDDFNRPPP